MKTLEALSKKYPHDDILIIADRLYPDRGRLVEYEHWNMNTKPVCAVAWIEFLSNGEYVITDRIELFQTRP